MAVHESLSHADVQFDYQVHIPFKSCALGSETTCAYLDFVVTREWGILVIEVDEGQHSSYPLACDVRRDFDTAASVALGSGQKLVILRYNPDSFRVNMTTRTVSKKDRLTRLLTTIQNITEPTALLTRLFLFYDRDSEDAPLPTIAKEWTQETRDVSQNAPQ